MKYMPIVLVPIGTAFFVYDWFEVRRVEQRLEGILKDEFSKY